jgi:hypothetical protein
VTTRRKTGSSRYDAALDIWVKTAPKAGSASIDRDRERFRNLCAVARLITPQVQFLETDVDWISHQKNCRAIAGAELTVSKVLYVAELMDELHDAGVVHGDLCTSNLIHDGQDSLGIIDWEISLERRDENSIQLRSTPYCIHPNDIADGLITERTDKFALAALVMINLECPAYRSRLSRDIEARNDVARKVDACSSMVETAELFLDLAERSHLGGLGELEVVRV